MTITTEINADVATYASLDGVTTSVTITADCALSVEVA